MRFEVLGSLRVAGGAKTGITSPKQQLLLAVLLSHTGRIVSADRLSDALWGDTPPESERKRLAWHVNRLRQCLDRPDRITWDRDGYRIAVGHGEFDAREFEELCDGATKDDEATTAVNSRLHKALRMWRGNAYGDLADAPALRSAAAHLDQLRLVALEERIRTDLDLGRHLSLIPELTTLLSQHPSREPFAVQLMIALYRSGRQTEALEVCRRVKTHLAQRLGLDPGARLRATEQGILAGDRELLGPAVPSATVPAEVPALPAGFVGRDTEVNRLESCLTSPRTDGRPALVLVTGIGGIGKSALAIYAAHRIVATFPDGQLYANLYGATPNATPVPPAAVLARFLHALGDSAAELANTDVDELSARFRSMTVGKRILIVLDNAHTAEQIWPLLPATSGSAVVITSRDRMTALDGLEHLRLRELSPEASRELLTTLAGASPDMRNADVEAVADLCGHLPLALCIAAAQLRDAPAHMMSMLLDRLRDDSLRLSALEDTNRAVGACFAVSYDQLDHDDSGRETAHLFRLLSLAPHRGISVEMAAALADSDNLSTENALWRLLRAQLLEMSAHHRYRMHDLLRAYAHHLADRDESSLTRQQAWRRLVHSYVATVRTALHLKRPVHSTRTMIAPLEPDHDGVALSSVSEAHDWIAAEVATLQEVVLAASQDAQTAEAAVALGVAVAPILVERGHYHECIQISEEILASPRLDDSLAALVRFDLGEAHLSLGDVHTARHHFEAGLGAATAAGDRRRMASCLGRLASVSRRGQDFTSAIAYLERSTALSRTEGAQGYEATNLTQLGLIYGDMGDVTKALAAYRQALELYRVLRDVTNQASVTGNIGYLLHGADRHAEAVNVFESALELDREAAQLGTVRESDHHWGLGDVWHAMGQHDKARACWNKSASILFDLGLISTKERHHIENSPRPPTPRPHDL